MKIAIANPETFFSFFYVLSFAVSFIIVIAFTIRRKIDLRSVLLMLTTLSLFTIVGSRLFTIPFSEWGRVVSTGSFEENYGRSAVGGLLFGLGGLVFAKRFFGLGMPVLNLYAWLTPLAFGIQKLGCFFNGCCYGRPTELPWGVQYQAGTNVHHFHWVHEMVGRNAEWSLNVHPVQLYEAFLFFLTAYIVWVTRNKWKKNGSIILFSLILFFTFRFAVEFFRDPSVSIFTGNSILGISAFQWFILLSGIVLFIILIVNEQFLNPAKSNILLTPTPLYQSVIYIIFLTVIIYLFRGLFSKFELVSLYMRFIPAIVLMAIHIFRSPSITRLTVATASILLFPLFLVTPTFQQDTIGPAKAKEGYFNDDIKSYFRIGISSTSGNYYSPVKYVPEQGHCGGTITAPDNDYKYSFRMASVGLSKIKVSPTMISDIGMNITGGSLYAKNLTGIYLHTSSILDMEPYFKSDWEWFGFGAGLNIGALRWIPTNLSKPSSIENGTKFFPVIPGISLRFGRPDILDLKYEYGYKFSAPFPVLMNEISGGSGFGSKHNFNIRYGASVGKSTKAEFLSAEGFLTKNFGLNFRYNWGETYLFNLSNQGFRKSKWFVFGANYNFGFNK